MVATRSRTIVGRDVELGVLRDAWLRAQTGRPVVAVVEGEAGIGKTRSPSSGPEHPGW